MGVIQPGSVLPPDAAALAELLLERLDAATGEWELTFEATDGRLRRWSRRQRGGRDKLEGFGRDHAATRPAAHRGDETNVGA